MEDPVKELCVELIRFLEEKKQWIPDPIEKKIKEYLGDSRNFFVEDVPFYKVNALLQARKNKFNEVFRECINDERKDVQYAKKLVDMKDNATERKNKLFQLCKHLLNKKNNYDFKDTIGFLKENLADLNIALVIEYIPDDEDYDSVLSFLFEEVLNM